MVIARLTPAVAQQLALGARDVLSQGAAVLTGNQGDYIANGDPQSIYGKIQQATARQYCRRYADNPDALPGAVGAIVESACRPYLGAIGYGAPPTIKTPFQGGQCPVVYIVQIGRQPPTGPAESDIFRRTLGPIAGFRTVPVVGNPGTVQIQLGSHSNVLSADTCGSVTGAGGLRFTTISSRPEGTVFTVKGLTPCSGSDDCGNPPPDVTSPTPPPVPGPRRERYNPSPDIDIDIDIEINPDGGFDVDFGIGPVTVAPPGGDGDSGGGGQQPDPGQPGTPAEPGPGGDAEGEAPPNSVLVGLRIEILEFPATPKLYADGVYRGVCYVYMGTEGLLDHDPAGAMLRADQFVYAERENLTHWRVSANTGYSLRVTPYYRELEAETV